MGKFAYALLTLFAIELSLWFFGGTTFEKGTLFDLIFNPHTLLNNSLYITVIVGTLGFFALAVVVAGNFFNINIYALYAGISVILITFVWSIAHLFVWLHGELVDFMPGNFSLVVSSIVTAPFLVFYLIAVTEWVRSNT